MKKKINSYEYIFFVVFIFVQLIGTILKINGQIDKNIHLTVYNVIAILLISIVIAYPISAIVRKISEFIYTKYKLSNKTRAQYSNKNKISWLYIWIGISILWFFYFLAFYPGIFAYDIENQWGQYFGLFGYSTYHPILHTFLMGKIIDIGQNIFGDYNKGVACYCLIQSLSLSGAVAYVLYYIKRFIYSKIIFALITLYFVLFPVWPFLGISTTKDTYFAIFFLLCFMVLLDCCISEISKGKFILAVLTLAISLLFRNNAIYGVILVIVCLLILLIVKQNLRKKFLGFLGIFLISIVIAKGINGQLIKMTNASEGSIAEMLSIPCQQIARVYTEEKKMLTKEEKKEIYQYIPKDHIVNYRWQLSDPIKGYLNTDLIENNWNKFLKLWLRLGWKYPREYLEAPLSNTLPLWYVWDESMISIHGVYLESNVKDITDGKVVRNSKLESLEKILTNAFSKGYALQFPIISLLFIPALYIWIIIAISFLMIKYKQYDFLVLPVFLIGYAITLIAGPCILPRYCMNFMLCVPPLLVCMGKIILENKIKDKS